MSDLENFKTYLSEVAEPRKLAKGTQLGYYISMRAFIKKMGKFTEKNVTKYWKKLISDSRKNSFKSAAVAYGKFLGLDKENNWAQKFPILTIYRKPKKTLTDNEIMMFLHSFEFGSRNRTIAEMLVYTAARPSSVLQLKRDDVNVGDDSIIFRNIKHGNDHEIVMPDEIMDNLITYLNNTQSVSSEWAFPSFKGLGGPIGVRTWGDIFYEHCLKIGVDAQVKGIKPYSLKHYCISRLVDEGVNPFELRDITGHRKLESLLWYYAKNKKKMKKNFNKDRLAFKNLSGFDIISKTRDELRELKEFLEKSGKIKVDLLEKGNSSLSFTVCLV